MEWKTGISPNCQTQRKKRNKERQKEDEDKYQRNALVRVVTTGGRDLREGDQTRNEGEINLAGSGLSEVVIIAGGEMMIALTWKCLLWAAMARSCAHMHARIDRRTRSWKRRKVGLSSYEYYNAPTKSPRHTNTVTWTHALRCCISLHR